MARSGAAVPLQPVSQPADDLVVLGMHQHHGALLMSHGQHVEDFAVRQPHGVIGHIHLETGVTAAYERRQLLPEDRRAGIGDDEMKAVIDDGVALGTLVVVGDSVAQRATAMLHGK